MYCAVCISCKDEFITVSCVLRALDEYLYYRFTNTAINNTLSIAYAIIFGVHFGSVIPVSLISVTISYSYIVLVFSTKANRIQFKI